MPRPRNRRRVCCTPKSYIYKPAGIKASELNYQILTLEEFEAIRLRYVEDMQQIDCAEKMQTSQSTFQRILASALKKTATALANGDALKIEETNKDL